MLFIRSTDDRDRPVWVRFSGLRPAAALWWEQVRARTRRENFRVVVGVARRPSTWLVFAAALLIGVLAAVFVHDGAIGLGVLVLGPVAAPLLMVGIVAVRAGVLIAGRASDMAEEALLRRGRCPACGYDLAGLEAQADLRVECPECGAAWRAGRIGLEGSSDPEVIVIRRA
ncbi:MAG: hypothetical protein KF745_03570 [Phycisphaeraceae bacterium]|nr:hypothetical protein [Phycisphaeraceae bacterium]